MHTAAGLSRGWGQSNISKSWSLAAAALPASGQSDVTFSLALSLCVRGGREVSSGFSRLKELMGNMKQVLQGMSEDTRVWEQHEKVGRSS